MLGEKEAHMGRNICIVGGSGFVGRAIVDQAVKGGHRVTVACRHPQRARDLLVKGAKLVRADVVDGRGLDEAVAGADVVIYLVGLLYERGRYTFQAAHVDGVERVLAACQRAGVKQFLHMSALGAGKVPESKYAVTKGKGEALVRQSGLNWTIFQPSVIYGAGDSFFNKFKRLTSVLPFFPIISGDARLQPVWVKDVARAFVASVDNRQVAGQSYELGGPQSFMLIDLLKMLMRELGRKRFLFAVPHYVALLMATFAQFAPKPPLTRDQLVLLKHESIVVGEPFPPIFGQPAALENVLPPSIRANQPEQLQYQLDLSRRFHRKGGI